jgi:hypothetical protein
METVSDQLLTTLLVVICNRSHCSNRVLYDLFQEEKHKLITELKEAYTDQEIQYIEDRIEQYDFPTFIQTIVYEDTLPLD